VIEQSVAESRAECLVRAFLEGAESGMVEVRGYGLTAEEREATEREAVALYGGLEEPQTITEDAA
jgi:hypothetical protein